MFDLLSQNKTLEEEIFKKWRKIFHDSSFTYGVETKKFEKSYSKFCQTKYAVAVRSGTASLIIALKAIGISLGDEVITTPMTFTATADSIVLCGAKPVFVDVDPQTGNIDPKKIEEKITKKTKAILVVHLYGVPCDLNEIMAIADRYGLKVVEDASHAHGSLYNDRKVGSFGSAGCFSLYPSKTLGSFGNAGIITSNDKSFIKRATAYAHHGIMDGVPKYTHHLSGYNELIDNLQSAVLLTKLKRLPKWIDKKLSIAQKYNQIFKESGHQGMIWYKGTYPSLYVYAVQIEERKKFQKLFKDKGIETGIYYPIPLHLQPAFKDLKYKQGDFPMAEKFSNQTVSLPLRPELKESQVNKICATISDFFNG